MTRRASPMNLLQQTMKVAGLLMVALYIVAGLALTFGLWDVTRLNRQQALVLGIVLLGYGMFRAWRQYKKFRDVEDE